MELELVSFKLCPFVQRSVITLEHKGVDYDITYIDLDNKPDWFLDKSPLGLVPILIVKQDGKEDVIFESAVINEFVDEVTEGRMLPDDAVARAKSRAWIEFASQAFGDFYQIYTATDADALEAPRKALREKMERIESVVVGPWFNGDEPTLVDASFAPLLMRLESLNQDHDLVDFAATPTVAAWKDKILSWDAVGRSIVPEWEELMHKRMQEQGSALAVPQPTP